MAGLLDVGLVFVSLAVAGGVAVRFGLSTTPLYVLGGVIAGPHVAGAFGLPHVPDDEVLAILGELGVVLLLFFLGLEFSFDRLLAARRRITAAGTVDFAVNFPVGVVVGLAFGWTVLESLLLGGIVYISSSAIVSKSLIDLGWIADPESEAVLGVLVFEDLVIAIYLAVVTSLVRGSGDLAGTARSVGVAVVFLLALALAVAKGTTAFQSVGRTTNRELFVVRVLALAIPVAGIALALGVSEAVAAFFVGTGFATTDHVERIERLLSPLRDVFAAIFFFWIGVGTDPELLVGVAGLLGVVVALSTPAKLLSGYRAGRLFGLTERRSVRAGAALVARGEFSLVIGALAAAGTGRIMTEVVPAFAVGYVLVMSLLGTVLMQHADRLGQAVLRG